MKLQYMGYDLNGKPVSEDIEARSVTEATDQLRRDGIFVLEIKESLIRQLRRLARRRSASPRG